MNARPDGFAISNFAGQDLAAMPSVARGEAAVHQVPPIMATAETLAGYGRPVADFASAEVTIVPWPVQGRRPLVPGTGNEGGTVEDVFEMEARGGLMLATNRAVGRSYVTGWYGDPAAMGTRSEPADRSRILTHEANYHPDGGQIFYPRDGAAFVALLAKPSDEVTPGDFRAFRFDGSFGVHIDPGVWHQPVFPLDPPAVFDDRQGRVHACVAVDFLTEFGCYLSVPLG
jgi:ureidoglycolate lyase